jgi:glycine amidinotransferase
MNNIVSSYNEWDPLEEVIVGAGLPDTIPGIDISFRLFFYENIGNAQFDVYDYITKQHIEEHGEDLDKFADLLKSLGVVVRRPVVPPKINKVQTPWWESGLHPALNVRDQCMVVGDTIIESPPTLRYRYFENDLLKPLFLEYFKQGCGWIQAPKSTMVDNSFDKSWVNDDGILLKDQCDIFSSKETYIDHGLEMMFDCANCMRLGKHILMNVSNKNQALGLQWLRKVLPDYTIWDCPVADSHIDSSFLPLKPGLAIITKPEIVSKLPEPLQNWDLIHIPMIQRTSDEYSHQNIKLASPRIELNVFSVSPELIICHPQYEKELNKVLKPYKIEAIGSPFRHCEIFSGAHHCTTLDIRRNGKLQNYFE